MLRGFLPRQRGEKLYEEPMKGGAFGDREP
jgi:hypothetical protein